MAREEAAKAAQTQAQAPLPKRQCHRRRPAVPNPVPVAVLAQQSPPTPTPPTPTPTPPSTTAASMLPSQSASPKPTPTPTPKPTTTASTATTSAAATATATATATTTTTAAAAAATSSSTGAGGDGGSSAMKDGGGGGGGGGDVDGAVIPVEEGGDAGIAIDKGGDYTSDGGDAGIAIDKGGDYTSDGGDHGATVSARSKYIEEAVTGYSCLCGCKKKNPHKKCCRASRKARELAGSAFDEKAENTKLNRKLQSSVKERDSLRTELGKAREQASAKNLCISKLQEDLDSLRRNQQAFQVQQEQKLAQMQLNKDEVTSKLRALLQTNQEERDKAKGEVETLTQREEEALAKVRTLEKQVQQEAQAAAGLLHKIPSFSQAKQNDVSPLGHPCGAITTAPVATTSAFGFGHSSFPTTVSPTSTSVMSASSTSTTSPSLPPPPSTTNAATPPSIASSSILRLGVGLPPITLSVSFPPHRDNHFEEWPIQGHPHVTSLAFHYQKCANGTCRASLNMRAAFGVYMKFEVHVRNGTQPGGNLQPAGQGNSEENGEPQPLHAREKNPEPALWAQHRRPAACVWVFEVKQLP
ncbi:hypothetical protein Pelo_4373 [Pelomyxa schiedti]|nr:hypothetical protein Pelo_4373 [Pelomyxa schiedti]